MQQIHEHRRIQYFGTKEEKKQISGVYKGECDFQVEIAQAKRHNDKQRDTFETERCQDLFNQQTEIARRQDLEKKQAWKRTAEENRMLADNKCRQDQLDHVTTNMKNQSDINANKFKPPTMFR